MGFLKKEKKKYDTVSKYVHDDLKSDFKALHALYKTLVDDIHTIYSPNTKEEPKMHGIYVVSPYNHWYEYYPKMTQDLHDIAELLREDKKKKATRKKIEAALASVELYKKINNDRN